MSPPRIRPSLLQFLREHPPMILGVIALHVLALRALIDTRLPPGPMPFELGPSITVVNPVPSLPPAPMVEPAASPRPPIDARRGPRAQLPPSRSTAAARPLDRSTGRSDLPEAAASASDAEAHPPTETTAPPLDPAATARAISDIARHPLLPGSKRDAPMTFGDKLARDLGSDERTTEAHLANGVIRIRGGNKCILSSPSRTADPFTQANAPTPRLTTSCD